jgi:hypothetical protein
MSRIIDFVRNGEDRGVPGMSGPVKFRPGCGAKQG